MSEPAISIRNLSKCYRLGTIGRQTLADEAQYWWHKVRGRDPRNYFGKIRHQGTQKKVEAEREIGQEFWALRDVSFDVQAGEVVGIVGRNGAGKSTLLKLLTRITEPTSGEVVINGRVASLLEVGTGFHPELTGRENIFMNGTILGMKNREIAAKFDEIVSFSELDQFIDTPVKRYSSGMYVRLAFAVAAHLEPEILFIDEVLAVGDAQFQRKCLGKMESIAQQGRTVLFVSHQMGAIAQLCGRVVVLGKGKLLATGPTEEMIDFYLTNGAPTIGNEYVSSDPASADQIRIRSARTVDAGNRPRTEFDYKESVALSMDVDFPKEIPRGTMVGIALKDHLDRKLFSAQKAYGEIADGPGPCRFTISMPAGLLTPGHYSFAMALHVTRRQVLDFVPSACRFAIMDTGSEMSAYAGADYGAFFVDCKFQRISQG